MSRVWPGLGMNVGYDITYTEYNAERLSRELDYLKSAGVSAVRFKMPLYNAPTAHINFLKNACEMAIGKGFYVTWGVTMMATITSTNYATYKAFVISDIVPWAESAGLSELALGNEFELKTDGTTLTNTAMRLDMRVAFPQAVRTAGYTGVLSYCTSTGVNAIEDWISEGIGSDLDILNVNTYDTIENFGKKMRQIRQGFPIHKVAITEWGSKGEGIEDFRNYDGFKADTERRYQFIKDSGVPRAYYFLWHGPDGENLDKYSLVMLDDSICSVWDALNGKTDRTMRNGGEVALNLSSTNVISFSNNANNEFVNTGQYTWVGTFQIRKRQNKDLIAVLMTKQSGGVSGFQIFSQYNQLFFQERKTYTGIFSDYLPDIEVGKWHTYAVTYDGTAQEVKIYFNGRYVGGDDSSFVWAECLSNTSSLSVGAANANENLQGTYSNFGMYQRILTEAEVLAYHKGEMPSTPSLWTDFDDNYGLTASDKTGGHAGGTVSQAYMWTAGPKMQRIKPRDVGKSLVFDGVDDYATLPILPDTTGFSFAFWLKTYPTSGFGRVLDYYDGSSNGIRLLMNTAITRGLTYDVRTAGTGGVGSRNGMLSFGQWQHVAVTNIGGKSAIYIDGVLSGYNASSTLTVPTGQTFTLGKLSNAMTTYGKFRIADFIYKPGAIMTGKEIMDHMIEGKVPAGVTCHHQFRDSAVDLTGNGNNLTIVGASYNADVPIPILSRGAALGRAIA